MFIFGFIVGCIIGGSFGFIITAIVTEASEEDDDAEI